MVHSTGINPSFRSQPGIVLAAFVLLLATLVACGNIDSPAPESSTPAAPNLERAPTVSWRTYQSVMLPFSQDDGPAIAYDTAPHGYAHTPQGALIAGLQAEARLSLAPDQTWPAVVNALIAPGAGRDRFATARAAVSITTAPDPIQVPAYVGYRWDSYTDAEAKVHVAVQQNGQLTSKQLILRWVHGFDDKPDDWMLLLPVDGVGDSPIPMSSLDGFIKFGSQP
jgi:hypothetical protein